MNETAGVILAGGRATRMEGRDKAFVRLAGRPLVERCIERLGPQAGPLAINSNAGGEPFATYGLPVLADLDGRRSGPLAGVLAGLRWAATLDDVPRAIATVAVDTPFFPADLVARLAAAGDRGKMIAMAASDGSTHPTFALWPLALADDLERFIDDGASLKVTAFAEAHGRVLVDFPVIGGTDPFFNVNKPDDLAMAERLAGSMP